MLQDTVCECMCTKWTTDKYACCSGLTELGCCSLLWDPTHTMPCYIYGDAGDLVQEIAAATGCVGVGTCYV